MSSAKDLGIEGLEEDNLAGDLVPEDTITEEAIDIVNMLCKE